MVTALVETAPKFPRTSLLVARLRLPVVVNLPLSVKPMLPLVTETVAALNVPKSLNETAPPTSV